MEVLFQYFSQNQFFPVDGTKGMEYGIPVCPDIGGCVDVNRDWSVNGHLVGNGMDDGVDLHQGIGHKHGFNNRLAHGVLEVIPGKGDHEKH